MMPRLGQRALIALPPMVQAEAERILARAARGRIVGCSHLDRMPIATVCLMHPAMLRCEHCHAQHAETHTEVEEYGCDVCGEDLRENDLALFITHPLEVDVIVPLGGGRSAAVGYVVLGGWGCCPSHASEVTR